MSSEDSFRMLWNAIARIDQRLDKLESWYQIGEESIVDRLKKLEDNELQNHNSWADHFLERLMNLETFQRASEFWYERIAKLDQHKHHQIDENRLSYNRINEIEEKVNYLVINLAQKESVTNLAQEPICNKCNGSGRTWK